MVADLYITGHGNMLVPRVPFLIVFRPPVVTLQCGAKAVSFGPAETGLGFKPHGDATIEDVTLDVAEYPPVPIYRLHTKHFSVPVTDAVVIYSAQEDKGRSFELQLTDAAQNDEMLWLQGPFASALDLQLATSGLEVVDTGTLQKQNGSAQWRECRYPLGGETWTKAACINNSADT